MNMTFSRAMTHIEQLGYTTEDESSRILLLLHSVQTLGHKLWQTRRKLIIYTPVGSYPSQARRFCSYEVNKRRLRFGLARRFTWFNVQGVLVYGQVHGLVGSVAEILQDEVDCGGHFPRNRLPKLHPAVDHNAAVSEIQDLQVLEVAKIGLQVWYQLERKMNTAEMSF